MKVSLPFLLHAAGWGVYLLFNLYAVGLRQPARFYLAYQGLHLAGNLLLFYINYFYFIPQLLARERALRFFAFNGLVLAVLPVAGIELDGWLSRTYGGMPLLSPDLPYNQQVTCACCRCRCWSGWPSRPASPSTGSATKGSAKTWKRSGSPPNWLS